MPGYQLHDVTPDGSCFYRSLYNVLRVSGYLIPFCVFIFGNQMVNDEDDFVVNIRTYISTCIRRNKDGGHIHDIFDKLSTDDSDTYDLILEGMPSWFSRLFPKQPSDENAFRTKIARAVMRTTAWASEIDIPIVTYLFRKCFRDHVRFVILNTIPKRFTPLANTLYVVNIGEAHYNYLVPRQTTKRVCDSTEIRNPQTRRCVKINGRVGKRVLRHKNTDA